jgi:error-prone DNA polymerase
MLSCIRRAFGLLAQHYGKHYTIATLPKEDPAVYDMLCHADSIGVFQVESRAQMSMLPRLKPRQFFDLVIEVAIVRPGPIQGDMVHPYLRRRLGEEPIDYPPGLEAVLKPTFGVPLFQEQAMKIAMIGAGFTAGEADGLRRAMATFRHNGEIHRFERKFIAGMLANGYAQDFAVRCFEQIKGFSEYGFPLSHAASFALLVYVSAWLKRFHPEVFACALLNSQPMGFYAPAQIVRDAREHGVELRPADVNCSDWDCTLEEMDASSISSPSPLEGEGRGGGTRAERDENEAGRGLPPTRQRSRAADLPLKEGGGETHRALRLGFRQVKGLAQQEIEQRLVARRGAGFRSPADLRYRTQLNRGALEKLADADAFRSLGLDRRQALWAVKGLDPSPRPSPTRGEGEEGAVQKPSPLVGEGGARPKAGKVRGPAPAALPLFASLAGEPPKEPPARLPAMGLGEHVVEDYRTTGLSLKRHPLALLRAALDARGILPHRGLLSAPPNRRVKVAGLVLVRQQPATASGVIFMTLEDETGIANIVVWRKVFERFRPIVMGGKLVEVEGPVQREGEVIHVVAQRLIDLSPLLQRLSTPSRAPADLRVESRDFR